MDIKPVILTLTHFYLPGYKGGGPIRTISSMVDMLGDEFDFKIITNDRDLGDDTPYPDVFVNKWQKVGKAQVIYIAPRQNGFFIYKTINATRHHILYLNSCFSPTYSIIPLLLRRIGLLNKSIVIVAPRGEFSPGAIKLKSLKKKMYLYAANLVGLYKDVIWQASSEHEKNDIITVLSKNNILTNKAQIKVASNAMQIVIAPDLSQPKPTAKTIATLKERGSIKLIFLSRISPKKNLDGALDMLRCVRGSVIFDIYGPLEDMVYWGKCQEIIKTLPPNIQVNYIGMLAHNLVSEAFINHDLFLFPTHGENFGHVIIEALVAGCPILISDQTPWRNLEESGVGWDIPLSQPEKFAAAIQDCVDMDSTELQSFSRRAVEYGMQKAKDTEVVQQNRVLFKI